MHLFVCLGRWVYCRRYYRYNYLLRHHHLHRILLLLCLLPVLPLSYTRCCGRHPTALSTLRLNSYPCGDDAASTGSSAGQLQPASSTLPKLPSTFNSASPSSRTSSSRSDACCSQRCPTGEVLTLCTRQPRAPAFL